MALIQIALALAFVGIAAWLINGYIRVPISIKPIINIVLMLIIVGIALWLINTYIPMAGSIRAILNLVVVIATCVCVLRAFGLWNAVVRMWDDLTHHRMSS
jgi:hypothetical protein